MFDAAQVLKLLTGRKSFEGGVWRSFDADGIEIDDPDGFLARGVHGALLNAAARFAPESTGTTVVPDAYPGAGGVPSTYLLRESAERNGFILTGDGRAEQLPGESHGGARIKLVSLVATSASVAHGSGQVAATAEFRDIELEMIAMLLAA